MKTLNDIKIFVQDSKFPLIVYHLHRIVMVRLKTRPGPDRAGIATFEQEAQLLLGWADLFVTLI